MSKAKEDLVRLANALASFDISADPSTAVDLAIVALHREYEHCAQLVAERAIHEREHEQKPVVLVASNKAKVGQQPWSQWDQPFEEVVKELIERVGQNPHLPGFQYEVIEVLVVDHAHIETIVNVRGK